LAKTPSWSFDSENFDPTGAGKANAIFMQELELYLILDLESHQDKM
jgi:hypothetical protein